MDTKTCPMYVCHALAHARAVPVPSTHVDLVVLEAEFQVVVDGLVGDFAQQREVRDTNLLFLGRLECGLLHLRLPPALSSIAHIGGFGAPESSTLLLSTERAA